MAADCGGAIKSCAAIVSPMADLSAKYPGHTRHRTRFSQPIVEALKNED